MQRIIYDCAKKEIIIDEMPIEEEQKLIELWALSDVPKPSLTTIEKLTKLLATYDLTIDDIKKLIR